MRWLSEARIVHAELRVVPAEMIDAEVAPDLRHLVSDLRDASASPVRVTAELERDPGTLVAGRAQPQPGPGE